MGKEFLPNPTNKNRKNFNLNPRTFTMRDSRF